MNNAFIITIAYPDTIVRISDEWFLRYLHLIGVGKKNYVRAGHAALVLINKETGILEYHDFGRYISPKSNGRVRGKSTDYELDFPLRAHIKNDSILNLDAILNFLATNPKLTHGEGRMVASVCSLIDYDNAKTYIKSMQEHYFVKYAVFKKNGSNCSRFVTDALIASVTNNSIRKKLINSKWFTPSTVGNVLLSNTEESVFEVSDTGEISKFNGSKNSENFRCFLDRLKKHEPNFIGNLEPVKVEGLHFKAQWLSGIGAGAWFELHDLNHTSKYRFRRIAPSGNIDVDGVYEISKEGFNSNLEYAFVYESNCKFFNIKQHSTIYKFKFLGKYESAISLMQKEHSA